MIEYVVWVSRLAVSSVFALAAFGKVIDQSATRRAVGEFGVPARFVRVVGWSLPTVEAVLAIAVLPPWSARWAGLAAVAVLAVFTAAIVGQLARGQRPSCSCFGGVSNRPVSGWTVARNAAIAIVAGITVLGSWTHPSTPADLPVDRATGLALFGAVGAVLVWQGSALRTLRRQFDERASRELGPEGLPVGAVAPEFDLPATSGGHGTLGKALAEGLPLVLVFMHPGCRPCADLAGELPRWRERKAGVATFLVIGSGGVEANRDWADEHRLGDMLVQDGNEVAARYRVRGTPGAVLVDTDGRIATPVAGGSLAIRDLIITTGKRAPRTRD